MTARKNAVGRQGLIICIVSSSVYDLTTVCFSVLRDFHLTFILTGGGGGEDAEGCCVFKRESVCVSVCERKREKREGPLCPPETRKGIELICRCLVSAYGGFKLRDSEREIESSGEEERRGPS